MSPKSNNLRKQSPIKVLENTDLARAELLANMLTPTPEQITKKGRGQFLLKAEGNSDSRPEAHD